jgi:hypothetical protein
MALDEVIASIFRLKPGKTYLQTRESSSIEYKRAFNKASLPEYARDIASFANHSGGFLVFGVENHPHIPIGLQNMHFVETDEAVITDFLNEHFAPAIEWEKLIHNWENLTFGIIHVVESNAKPVIAINDGGRGQEIKDGEIYYRYVGRSEKIRHAELSQIIEQRIAIENRRWQELIQKIAQIGPENSMILNTIDGKIEEGNRTILIDDELIPKIKFIKEGQFTERQGAITLKLIGEIQPTSVIGVKERIIHDDPYIHRAKDVAALVAEKTGKTFRSNPEHVKCYKYYAVRGSYEDGKEKCNSEYCDYKESLRTFMYTQKWVDFLVRELSDPANLVIAPVFAIDKS